MDMTIKRVAYRADGIFSEMFDGTTLLMRTCEHAWPSGLPQYQFLPMVMPGKYVCVRGQHRLKGMKEDFVTFEILGVPGHSGVLFHWGNWNEDSRGCVLTGEAFAFAPHDTDRDGEVERHEQRVQMVTNSRVAFKRFMAAQEDTDRFTLTVLA